MAERPPGQWWDRSWNIVTGCTPLGAGCAHCWAQRMARRFPALHHDAWETVILNGGKLDDPRRRRKSTVYAVSLLGDIFHEQVPRHYVKALVGVAADCDRHQFVWLTKRWRRAAEFCADCSPPSNVLLMASIWDQSSADAACAALSRLRGVRWGYHAEPLIGDIDLTASKHASWVVVGAEQGPGARPFDLQWARSLRDQCRAAPFWFKSGSKRSEPPPDLDVRETPWGWR